MSEPVHTGGCQCGAVRFRIQGELKDASICHCRMCQKAFGNFYAPLVGVNDVEFDWTRGAPKYFQSSNYVKRGFCGDCGTPLSYEGPDGVGIAIGAFDAPERVRPIAQFGVEAKIDYVDHLHDLPGHDTMDDVEAASFLADVVSYQHPDHDTTDWTPKASPEPDHWRPKEQGV
jgi:hypothetical protein